MTSDEEHRSRTTAPVEYPVVYRHSAGVRVLCGLIGLFLLGISLAGIGLSLTTEEHLKLWPSAMLLLTLCLALVGAWSIGSGSFETLLMERDAIELRRAFHVRRLARAQLVGWRRLVVKGQPSGWMLVPKSGASLTIDRRLVDGRFDAWLAGLPDLNEQDRAAILRAIERDDALGATPAERRAALERAKRRVLACTVLAGACFMWSAFYPQPYQLLLVVLGLLPWLSLVLVWTGRGLVRFDGARSDPRPNIGAAAWLPCFSLFVWALPSLDRMLSVQPLLFAGALLGLPLGWTMIWASKELPSPPLQKLFLYAFLLCLSTAWGGGWLALVNTAFDRDAPLVLPVRVIDKHTTTGRSASHVIEVAAWGTLSEPREFRVSAAWYQQIDRGELVCVRQHPGLLGWPWLMLSACPSGTGPAAKA